MDSVGREIALPASAVYVAPAGFTVLLDWLGITGFLRRVRP